MWHKELERQNAIKQSKSDFANRWQPPGTDLLEDSRFHCNDGPIDFALDVINQRHRRQLTFVIRILHAMEAAPAYSPLEWWSKDGVAGNFQVSAPSANKRGGGGGASQAPAHVATEALGFVLPGLSELSDSSRL
jgi:hypothetical protein